MKAALIRTRELTEDEQWGRSHYNRTIGETIKCRARCEAPPQGRCISGATVMRGKRKLCRTHARIADEGRM
jgi:hypothetical protein